jgi:hypothetical protein
MDPDSPLNWKQHSACVRAALSTVSIKIDSNKVCHIMRVSSAQHIFDQTANEGMVEIAGGWSSRNSNMNLRNSYAIPGKAHHKSLHGKYSKH